MKKIICLMFIILLVPIISGCITIPKQQASTPLATTPSPQILSQPLFTRWDMVGNPSITQNGLILAVNAFYLTTSRILVFYSLSGSDSAKLASDEIFQILDDSGRVSELTEVIPLSKVDQLDIGLMVFEPRRIGVRQLDLCVTMKSDPKVIQKSVLAQLIGSASDDFLGREFYTKPLNNTELSGYRISISWGPPPENQSGGASSDNPIVNNTPIIGDYPTTSPAVGESTIALPRGVNIQNVISFMLENVGNKQVQYLGVQFLSDGNFLSTSNGRAVWPTPIVLITPVPLTQTYPPPTPYP